MMMSLMPLLDWYEVGTPVVFWLSGFYFPQAFLTGTKQNFARKEGLSIDTISFNTILVADGSNLTHPDKGAYVDGLFIEGARWDKNKNSIIESRPKELFTTMPEVWFQPERSRKKPENQYICPLYKTLARAGTLSTTGHSTNFVLPLEIPTEQPESHWIKRGVACVLALN
ncbi:Dynein-1-beta heavy chain [Diplonema papillatum]|nr:Dynein-1-beta heavy chain [Diplonema papillatum]